MARTLRGNYTGRAAQIEHCDLLEAIRKDHETQQAKIICNREHFRFMMNELKIADPTGWEAWFESDAIPEKLSWLDIDPVIDTIRLHIHELNVAHAGGL